MNREPAPYSNYDLDLDLLWWAAANYLTVGQIYLRDNVLLREPLRPEHIKPRLLGHWGTSPGLSLIYLLLNRLIAAENIDCLLVTGPGHGGPALIANAYLDGTYSELYPAVSQDEPGMRQLFKQFSTPGGVGSHAGPHTPGSIHEGGELGYALAHAAGAAFDNPRLVTACVIGDGEAETGPLAASWRLPAFLSPGRDGAVLPILHLNGYKISGPTVLGRSSDSDICSFLSGQGWEPILVGGDEPRRVFADLYGALVTALEQIQAKQGSPGSVRWPAIILRTPKGWTGPDRVDGIQVEGTFRAHQVPLANVRENPEHLRQLEEWMRSYRPESLFDSAGKVADRVSALAPPGDKRLSLSPYANGGQLARPLNLPDPQHYAVAIEQPGASRHETTAPVGELLRDIYRQNTWQGAGGNFRLFCPDETTSNRLGAVFEETDRCFQLPVLPTDDHLSPRGRVMEVLSEHLCQGWLEGYVLTGRHGVYASYEAFAMVGASMLIQHAKWLEQSRAVPWREPVPSLNVLLTSTCWRNDHNGFSHQGPGLIDTAVSLSESVVRIWLPPDANTTLAVMDRCLRSRGHVNLVIVDKQSHLQYLDYPEAKALCNDGLAIWTWAGTEAVGTESDGTESDGTGPDIILAAAGDVPTQEILAAAQLLGQRVPTLRVRVVNVADLMSLVPENDHPHGISDARFSTIFTDDVHVVFAFHGYPRVVHELLHGRTEPGRFHVRGFTEHGTTTTPFDMVVLNRMSRYDLVLQALRRSAREVIGAAELIAHCHEMLAFHHSYIREHGEDMPQIRDWTFQQAVGS